MRYIVIKYYKYLMGNRRNYNKVVNMLIKCYVLSCLRNKKSSSDILFEYFLD